MHKILKSFTQVGIAAFLAVSLSAAFQSVSAAPILDEVTFTLNPGTTVADRPYINTVSAGAEFSVLDPTSIFSWVVDINDSGTGTVLVDIVGTRLAISTAGFSDVFELSNMSWIGGRGSIIDATIVSHNFSGIAGPPSVSFTGNSVVFDTNNFGAGFETTFVQIAVTTVPEPAAVAVLGLGLVALGWMRRRCLV